MKTFAIFLMLAATTVRAQEDPPSLPPVEPIAYPAEAMLSETGREKLAAERKVFAQELLRSAEFDPDVVQQIIEALDNDAANTVPDNLRRIAEALARLNSEFAEGYEHYKAGRWQEASDAFAPLMEENIQLVKASYQHNTMPPFQYCITKHLWTECQGRLGNLRDLAIGYQVNFEKLPTSLTFAAVARYRCAKLYETTGRVHFAIPIYEGLAARFADSLSDEENLRLRNHIAVLKRVDPYRLAAAAAREASLRLERSETGKPTQHTQRELIDLLGKMMAMAEVEDRPFMEHTDVLAFGATAAELREGSNPDHFLTQLQVSMNTSDDWGKLRPRERQQIIEAFKQRYPQRYRDMLQAYFRNMSKAETEP